MNPTAKHNPISWSQKVTRVDHRQDPRRQDDSHEAPRASAARAPGSVDDALSSFTLEVPRKTLRDLVLSPAVREQIEVAIAMIETQDIVYRQWGLSRNRSSPHAAAISLTGPPGTGKSACAEALAHRFKALLLRVNYAELESKYPGDTAKNLVTVFRKAAQSSAVVFFDEADTILAKRLTCVTQSADRSVNLNASVMLTQLDQFKGIVVFASNLPENYDRAFARRILFHMTFELPDATCRSTLWESHLPAEMPGRTTLASSELSLMSEGLSGADISNAIELAAFRAARRSSAAGPVTSADIEWAIAQVRQGSSSGNRGS